MSTTTEGKDDNGNGSMLSLSLSLGVVWRSCEVMILEGG